MSNGGRQRRDRDVACDPRTHVARERSRSLDNGNIVKKMLAMFQRVLDKNYHFHTRKALSQLEMGERKKGRQRERETEREKERGRERETETEKERETERKKERQRERGRETERDRDKGKNRQRGRQRETETERVSERG